MFFDVYEDIIGQNNLNNIKKRLGFQIRIGFKQIQPVIYFFFRQDRVRICFG